MSRCTSGHYNRWLIQSIISRLTGNTIMTRYSFRQTNVTILTAGRVLQLQPPCRAVEVTCPHHPPLGVWLRTTGSLSRGGLSAVGSCQQGVEAIVCAGVILLVVDVTVVDAGAGERGFVHEHGAVAGVVSGLSRCRVLRERKQMSRSKTKKVRKFIRGKVDL